jgi:hypothetical protein
MTARTATACERNNARTAIRNNPKNRESTTGATMLTSLLVWQRTTLTTQPRDEAIVRKLEEMNTLHRDEHETLRKALPNLASRSDVQVAIEDVRDHIRAVAEGAAAQNEAVIRRLETMQKSFDQLREDNLSQHKTLLDVLAITKNGFRQ